MQMYLACTAEGCWDPEACAAETDVACPGWAFSLQTEAQMKTDSTAHTFHAEGRGGCGKPDFWPAPRALQETLTLTTYVSI